MALGKKRYLFLQRLRWRRDTSGERLESVLESGWDVWQQNYPHIQDLRLKAAYVRGILHSPTHSPTDYSQ